jgi:hypothetical protein
MGSISASFLKNFGDTTVSMVKYRVREIKTMPQDEEKNAAAIAAAGFDMMLLRNYYSYKNIVAVHLGEGLAEGGMATEAQELIERLANNRMEIEGTPRELAAKDDVACIALGELFATALANRDESYIHTIVPMEHKSVAIAKTLDAMNATTLARCFKPTLN